MNERIRELINEATSFKEGLIEGKYDNEVFDKEKFAELIVRECDRYVAEHYDEMEPWMQPGDLLEHFGTRDSKTFRS